MPQLVISYSRADQSLVRGLVALLRAGLRGIDKAVYWDEDFEPGDPWFDQIKAHIDDAEQLFVIWCCHSAESEQVRREVDYAVGTRRRVVPVMIDDSPLPTSLAPIHGINLRDVVAHQIVEKTVGRIGAIDRLGAKEDHGDTSDPLRRVFDEFTGFSDAWGSRYEEYVFLFEAFKKAFPSGTVTMARSIDWLT